MKNTKKDIPKKNRRVLSGIQPSGSLHLGNYFGMMQRMVKYQEQYDLYCFIANYHALTTNPSKENLKKNTFNAVCDFLALGIDPEKSTFWLQSDVPQVTELTWILSSIVGTGMMDRSTSYKDKINQGMKSNMGLYSYPILMASDILCYDTKIVPVGKDQKQHLEITRDIANRFNNIYSEVFIVPEPEIEKERQLIPGTDGEKMSKSYGNTIPIFSSQKEIRKKIMSIITDNTPVDKPKNTDTALFKIFSLFLDDSGLMDLKKRYDNPGLRYGDVKVELFELVMAYFEPFRKKREFYCNNPKEVNEILMHGAKKAGIIADNVIDRVRSAIGLNI
tara:strand:- start:390 stop:1388 length:999 start_codon:yes stop_codon:yes gene_type:complete